MGFGLTVDYDDDLWGAVNFINDELWHVSLKEAAELLTFDMWSEGEIEDVEGIEEWDGSIGNEAMLAQLKGHIAKTAASLAKAIDAGDLKTKGLMRDFDGNPIFHDVRILIHDFDDWLMSHNYFHGEVIEDWKEREADVARKLAGELAYLRALSRSDKSAIENMPDISNGPVRENEVDSVSFDTLKAAYKALLLKHDRLVRLAFGSDEEMSAQRQAKADKPLTTRRKRTYLTIIAALCDYSAIAHNKRGSAKQIADMTDEIAASVDEGTVKSILDEIPEALESRAK